MRTILIIIVISLSACATQKQVKHSFVKQYYQDTGYLGLKLPLFSQDYYMDEIMSQLSSQGYFEIVGYKTSNQRPDYAITGKAAPFLLREYYDSSRNEHIGIFRYYQLKRVQIKSVKYPGNSRDTAVITFKTQYTVVPMFDRDTGPSNTLVPGFHISQKVLYLTYTFARIRDGWKVYSGLYPHNTIYTAPVPERLFYSGSVILPDKLRQWLAGK